MARGETLFFDGYRAVPYAGRPGVYAVYRPQDQPLPKGCSIWYDVDICNGDCQCAAFERLGTCKHLRGLLKAVKAALEILAPMLPVPTVFETVQALNETGAFPGEEPGQFATAHPSRPAGGFGSREEFHRRRIEDFA